MALEIALTAALGDCKTVAELLDCSASTLKRIRNDPELGFPAPALDFGHPRFRLKDVADWIQEQSEKKSDV